MILGIPSKDCSKLLSLFRDAERFDYMKAGSEPITDFAVPSGPLDFAGLFHVHYPRIARVIARVVQDPARAEELASEVFWKLWRSPGAQGGNSGGWLYRTAVRMGLDELRRQSRRRRYEKLLDLFGSSPSPEQLHSEGQDQQHVRLVLSVLKVRDSSLLVLQSEGLSYLEMAEILHLNETSIGTLLRRAQQAFRKEYVKRYGERIG
jgi:RNA polymerase sigma-70 factor (ECF subfamily)